MSGRDTSQAEDVLNEIFSTISSGLNDVLEWLKPLGRSIWDLIFGAPTPTQTGATVGGKAKAVEALHAELDKTEKRLKDTAKPTGPAVLAGMFDYANSMVVATPKRMSQLKDDDIKGAKVSRSDVQGKIGDLRSALDTAKKQQVAESLKGLEAIVLKYELAATTQESALEQTNTLTGVEQSKARGVVYKAANAELTELNRAKDDWAGQIEEAKAFLGDQAGAFGALMERLGASATKLDSVVDKSLPTLTSRPAKPGEKPVDSGAGGGAPVIDKPEDAMEECGWNWVAAKQKYGPDKTQMQKLANYRKQQVDDWMGELDGKYGLKRGTGVGWVSVGSNDPTSDYDISINKHGDNQDGTKKFDYEVVAEFNVWFRGEFGGEGGTVFDTNLYASAPPLITDADPQGSSTNDVAALMKMRRYMSGGEFEKFRVDTENACGDNHAERDKVAKQFAAADNNYRIVIVDLLENGKTMLEKKIEAAGDGAAEEDKEFLHEIDAWLEKGKQGSVGIGSYDLIDEGEKLSHEIDHHLKDTALVTTNEVYADKMGDVRTQEQVVVELKKLDAALKATPPNKETLLGAFEAAQAAFAKLKIGPKKQPVDSRTVTAAITALKQDDPSGLTKAIENLTSSLAKELGMRLEQLGTSQAISRYFANEAYQSDGPFAHVVTATQAAEVEATAEVVKTDTEGKLTEEEKTGKDAKTQVAMGLAGGVEAFNSKEKTEQDRLLKEAQDKINLAVKTEKEKRQKLLPAEQCLQSFNEQLGDFLKDLEHYGDEDPGKAMIQSSKYLERLLDAARLMHANDLFKADKTVLEEIELQLTLQDSIKDELIAARKGNLMLVPPGGEGAVDQQEQRRAYACDFMKKKLGVSSLSGLAKKYAAFGVKVNSVARQALSAKK